MRNTPRLLISWALVAFLVGCSSSQQLTEVEKAKKISELRKEAKEQLEIYHQFATDPDGVNLDALQRYVELQQETTKVAPATCPVCFVYYGDGLRRLGLYYQNLVFAMENGLEKASPGEKAELQQKIAKYKEEMKGYFQRSNQQFQVYYMMCRRNNEPEDPETYLWVLRNCDVLEDYSGALHYLELYVANVNLTEEGKKNAEKLRIFYKEGQRRKEEESLRQELENPGKI